ncbi:MAG: lipid-A-disaccharide synthase N-terminal domain-containing protein [Culturomica sp.]|jgi:lipid-A-disaccharide synthase-like uncharacterized protein|nr:lipid-A-disaccharide synthase N-terminal domain-containing protein [Culturomica sp.]
MFWIYGIGFIAQGLFSARTFIQWILSEKAKRVITPTIYWQLSLLASFLFFIYGWLRDDFSIILGQLISYYVYIWNLNTKGHWKKLHTILRVIFMITPPIAITLFFIEDKSVISELFNEMSFSLLLFGSIAQVIFTLRFVYQWWYSREIDESVLPLGFFVMSIIGSSMISIYGFIRLDPVLILGQGVGVVVYARNIYLLVKSSKPK